MRGFLARAGHVFGRLGVSLGYGWGRSRYEDRDERSVVCMATSPPAPTLETALMDPTTCLATEIALTTLDVEPFGIVVTLATELDRAELSTQPIGQATLTTQLEEC